MSYEIGAFISGAVMLIAMAVRQVLSLKIRQQTEIRDLWMEMNRGPRNDSHVMILPDGWGSTFSGPSKPIEGGDFAYIAAPSESCHGCGAAPTKDESCPYCGRHKR